MEVRLFSSDFLEVNTYLIRSGSAALVIDSANVWQEVLDFLEEEKLNLEAIINTHGHVDHILDNEILHQKTGAPVWIHAADSHYLHDSSFNLSTMILRNPVKSPKAERLLEDGDLITLDKSELTVLHTPGHSPGSICLYGSGLLISGDTLFRSSVGRSDFPGGDGKVLSQSLQRLKALPSDTVIYPGHGPQTDLAFELKHNPFLR